MSISPECVDGFCGSRFDGDRCLPCTRLEVAGTVVNDMQDLGFDAADIVEYGYGYVLAQREEEARWMSCGRPLVEPDYPRGGAWVDTDNDDAEDWWALELAD